MRRIIAQSPSSENDCVDGALSESGDSARSQQDRSSGYGLFDLHNLPQSPIPDSAHPWDEIQHPSSTASVEETASDNVAPSRPRCDICNESFAAKSILTRHVKTAHKDKRKEYWVCTVKGCGKYNKPVSRKDNFRRHCLNKHPMVDLKEFGL
ncbi:hypothetical protein ACQKWADRAFT_313646 [Trichoderma austrokoningii]